MTTTQHSGGGNRRGTRASFGSIRKLPSGRYQARYTGPDEIVRRAPVTFDAKVDAEAWLATMRADIVREVWNPAPDRPKPITFKQYSEGWLAARTLEARTRGHYRRLLDLHLLPQLGDHQLARLSPQVVREWHAVTLIDKPTYRAHAYSLLRTILGQAVKDELLTSNPCSIAKAGTSKRVHLIRPATLDELEKIVTAMPERLRVMTLLAAWCGLRFGELTELRRSDVDTKRELLRIRRGVVRASGKVLVKKPKSDAGVRNVAIPPHLMPMLREHLLQFTAPEPDGLLFPASGNGHLAPSTLYRHFYSARTAAGRDDLRWHDLRHTGAVLAAQAGATLADLMARLGHSTPGAAMKYQHTAEGRDVLLAKALSRIAKRQA